MSGGAEPRRLNKVKVRLNSTWSEGVASEQPPEEERDPLRTSRAMPVLVLLGGGHKDRRGSRLQPGSQCGAWGGGRVVRQGGFGSPRKGL